MSGGIQKGVQIQRSVSGIICAGSHDRSSLQGVAVIGRHQIEARRLIGLPIPLHILEGVEAALLLLLVVGLLGCVVVQM
jgi:hypothetical protein